VSEPARGSGDLRVSDFDSDKVREFLTSESVVERAAEAMYQSVVKRVRDAVAKIPLNPQHYFEVFEEAAFLERSDRAVALTVYTLFDDVLIATFKRQLNEEVPDGLNSILEGSGFLSTSYNRMKMALGLYWITRATYQQVTLLRRIRNLFAHHIEIKTFDDQRIAGYISTFPKFPKAIVELPDAKQWFDGKQFTNRHRYLLQSTLLFQQFLKDLTVLPHAIRDRAHPGDVAGQYDDLPTKRLTQN
jgi:DNA-binding MltR family transcriptional regulator